MILEIVRYGHPVLRAKGRQVGKIDDGIRDLAENMLETMRDANGVGLAAQQVGVALQLAVVDVSTASEDRPSTMEIDGKAANLEKWMPLVFVNPRLEPLPERETGSEGCLSFPDITGDVERAASLVAHVELLDGRTLTFTASGLLARALQHEVDHLNGVLFIDRMSPATKVALRGRLKRLQREGSEG